jgi:aconitate hydratase
MTTAATAVPDRRQVVRLGGRRCAVVPLTELLTPRELAASPFCLRILAENVARRSPAALPAVLARLRTADGRCEVPVYPDRVMLHDTTCLPALADFAGLRDAVAELGGSADAVQPDLPVDLVVDHSVTVEAWGTPEAAAVNLAVDFRRNAERYRIMKWAEHSVRNFRVVPPGTGIIHQVNMEYLARVVWSGPRPGPDGALDVHPEVMLATDSHTPMINALGVLAWGVGGLEAQSAMLGEPVTAAYPRVVGVRLRNALPAGAGATDLALTVTERLRAYGVLGAWLEFCGDGLDTLAASDRATLANMAPEYGATCAFFPYDDITRDYLRLTARDEEHRALVDEYLRLQQLKREPGGPEPHFGELVDIDLAEVSACVSGPRRPDQRHPLPEVPASFRADVARSAPAPSAPAPSVPAPSVPSGTAPSFPAPSAVPDGAVAIAAITSCTNTANPWLLMTAGLVARNAVARGLSSRPWVKASLSPGSRAVPDYLASAGLADPLAALGFAVAGFGCMTCIGNSGPLLPAVDALVDEGLPAVAVLSGNRNFEGRVNPKIMRSYLASPALVVAYALAGSVTVDLDREPLGHDRAGEPVYLRDLWPDRAEVDDLVARHVAPGQFARTRDSLRDGPPAWQALDGPSGVRFPWDSGSTYFRRPSYVRHIEPESRGLHGLPGLHGARILLALGDNVTTDHISPAGTIPEASRAGRYLAERGVEVRDFNQYSTRRSNHEVMVRGAFTNRALRNRLLPEADQAHGGVTLSADGTRLLDVFAAADTYRQAGLEVVVVAGRNYGGGSSRDWAAKAQALLGVRAVIAASFERIHRGNLIGMGILPLVLPDGSGWDCSPGDRIDLDLPERLGTGGNELTLRVSAAGAERLVPVELRLDSASELDYLRAGGLLPYLARLLARRGSAPSPGHLTRLEQETDGR